MSNQKLKQLLETISSQEEIIEKRVKNIFKDINYSNFENFSAIELTKQLENCHPYMKFLKVELFTTDKKRLKLYKGFDNNLINANFYRDGNKVIRSYIISQLKQKARDKFI